MQLKFSINPVIHLLVGPHSLPVPRDDLFLKCSHALHRFSTRGSNSCFVSEASRNLQFQCLCILSERFVVGDGGGIKYQLSRRWLHQRGFAVDTRDFSIRRLWALELFSGTLRHWSRVIFRGKMYRKAKRFIMYERLIRDGEVESHNLNTSSLM